MKLSLAEKLLQINEALKLLRETGHEDQLNKDHILFQRGNNDMSAKQVTSDILQTNVRGELYEKYSTMTKKEDKTAMFNELINDLLKLGHVFVIFHDGRYYEINMSIDQVHNYVRSEKVAQLFRDRKSLEKKYISTFVALEKHLKRKIVYVSNLAVDKEIKKIYKAFLNVVKTKDQTSKEEKIHSFYETHQHNLAVLDAMLTLCADNHFVNLPQKVRKANPMQIESNESVHEDRDNGGAEADFAEVFYAISNEGDTRLEAGAVYNNEEAAESGRITFDLSFPNGNDGENHSTWDRGMNDTDLDRIIASDNTRNENNMDVDDGVNYEIQRAIERNVHNDEFMEWMCLGDNSSIDVSNLEDAQLSGDELLTVFE